MPLLERERWQLGTALLASFEILWPEITDLLEVSVADRYSLMDDTQRRDVTSQLVWLLGLCMPPEEP